MGAPKLDKTAMGGLSLDFKKSLHSKLRLLSDLQPSRTYLAGAFDWLLITMSIYCSSEWKSLVGYIIAISIIGSRQHALLVLMHEGAHRRIAKNIWLNDLLGEVFFAYPIFFDMAGYRENHLSHHSQLNSDGDPDWIRKISNPDWQFPTSQRHLVKILFKYLVGLGVLEWSILIVRFSGFYPLRLLKNPAIRKKAVLRLSYYLVGAVILTMTSSWHLLLFYWLIPYVFVFLVFQRIRSIAEHFALMRTHELSESRNVLASGLERFFLAPHNVGYHLDHHLFPSVPFYKLRQLHELLMQDSTYRTEAHQNTSYMLPSQRSLLSDLVKSKNG
jgi:fatty acid desaturase